MALFHLVVIVGVFCVTGIEWNQTAATVAFQEFQGKEGDAFPEEKSDRFGLAAMAAGDQRVVPCFLLEEDVKAGRALSNAGGGRTLSNAEASRPWPEMEAGSAVPGSAAPGSAVPDCAAPDKEEAWQSGAAYVLDEEDYDLLLRIVEAEAGSEDEDGRLLVANVVFNRVNSEQFPDTVSEVVLQQSKGVTQFSPVASGRIWEVDVTEDTRMAVQRALEGEDISQGALYFAARRHADSDSMRWFDEKLTFLFSHGGHEFFS